MRHAEGGFPCAEHFRAKASMRLEDSHSVGGWRGKWPVCVCVCMCLL